LAGTWSGRRIQLELAPKGQAYAGTLTLRKRALPVEVERGPSGWGGSLVQGERKAEFSLAREGEALVMVSDGRSYRLTRAPLEAAAWVGDYQGPREVRLSLRQDGEVCSGSLDLEGVRYVVRGRKGQEGLAGSLRDPLTGKELTWRASEVDESGLLFTIRLEEQSEEGRASFHALRFERLD
jgi:hypothetical protein